MDSCYQRPWRDTNIADRRVFNAVITTAWLFLQAPIVRRRPCPRPFVPTRQSSFTTAAEFARWAVLCSFCYVCRVLSEPSRRRLINNSCFTVVQLQTTPVIVFISSRQTVSPGPDIIFDRVCIVFSRCFYPSTTTVTWRYIVSRHRYFSHLTTANSGNRQLFPAQTDLWRLCFTCFLNFLLLFGISYLIIDIRCALRCGIFYYFSYRHNCTVNVYNYLRSRSSSPWTVYTKLLYVPI